MSKITKQDTNGVKPLLGIGELGYDNYPAGGDKGRVYVGTGTENIGLAKKTEVLAVDDKADNHIARVDNPHAVTKAQVGLGNADNTADVNKNVLSATKLTTARTIALSGDIVGSASFDGTANLSVSTTIQPNSVSTVAIAPVGTAGTYTKVTTNDKGQVITGTVLSASDIPSLDASKIVTGRIDAARLPAYVDYVLEYASLSVFPVAGESGKIYIALDTNKAYRWSGSVYIYITSGAVDSVAGKNGVVTLAKADVGLNNVDNTSDINKPISNATQTELDTKVSTNSDQTIAGVKEFSSSTRFTLGNTNSIILDRDNTSKYNGITFSTNNVENFLLFQNNSVDGNLNLQSIEDNGSRNTVFTVNRSDGVLSFSSSPIVPTPTSGTQAVNKDYVDDYAMNRIATSVTNLDTLYTPGTYRVNQGTTEGSPVNSWGDLLVLGIGVESSVVTQIITYVSNIGTYVRSRSGNVWSPWEKLVTEAHFTGDNQNFGANGYQKLPGGLIIQWGTLNVNTTSAKTWSGQTVTFPIAFSNSVSNIFTSIGQPVSNQLIITSSGSLTTTQAIIYLNSEIPITNQQINYIVVGK